MHRIIIFSMLVATVRCTPVCMTLVVDNTLQTLHGSPDIKFITCLFIAQLQLSGLGFK